jgi:hypothetical protein
MSTYFRTRHKTLTTQDYRLHHLSPSQSLLGKCRGALRVFDPADLLPHLINTLMKQIPQSPPATRGRLCEGFKNACQLISGQDTNNSRLWTTPSFPSQSLLGECRGTLRVFHPADLLPAFDKYTHEANTAESLR